MLQWCWCSGWHRDYETGVEPPGEFSATLAACGSSSTFFVVICNTFGLKTLRKNMNSVDKFLSECYDDVDAQADIEIMKQE